MSVGGIETAAFVVDATAGVVTLDAAPDEGVAVTAGFTFDAPVRFDMDRLETVIEGGGAIRLGPTSVVELLG